MSYRTPEESYARYKRMLDSEEYEKAYKCLKSLLKEFPDDISLLENIVELCFYNMRNTRLVKPWLIKLLKFRPFWRDYLMLSQVEADLDNIPAAKKHLNNAKNLETKQGVTGNRSKAKNDFSKIRNFIRHKELMLSIKKQKVDVQSDKKSQLKNRAKTSVVKTIPKTETKTKPTQKIENIEKTEKQKKAETLFTYNIPIKYILPTEEKLNTFLSAPVSRLKETMLLHDYTRLTIQSGFDELLCLNKISGINKFWYQIETVKRVLKYFHGRVLLCDEVGLGKTIEAGMLLKEYLMRGMARNVLILTPPPLVSQWKEEMQVKFGVEFLTTDDPEFARDSEKFWEEKFIVASIHKAKSKNNMLAVTKRFYDIVIVDEAHHLRNRTTLGWKLVNQIKKKFIFLLTATPVQNNLIELYNLITLLRPGQFKTEKIFKQEYVKKGNLRVPVNREKLKELLRDVMVRNTRSVIDLKLPKRFATTMRLEATKTEHDVYVELNAYLRKNNFRKNMVNLLLREAGSSPFALVKSLLKLPETKERNKIIELIKTLEGIAKGKALIDIISKNPQEKKIVFTQYIKSMDYIMSLLEIEKIPYATFNGNMSTSEKNAAIKSFKDEIPVLVSTESGGEGRNLQFCRTIINFDLPWNPMKIEQRIGRLHRIGQTRDVFIFNLSIRGTIEDHIVDILDNKINMFEMVIGEIEPILGQISKDDDFEHIIMDIWLKSGSEKEVKDGFEELGKDLVKAKKEYLEAKALDDEIFGEDYET